ncbi:IDEAL domain-containing protein [Alteribacillus bidgolensis]|uniref:IDEAL domain-containing protein n=1 Tax=Alteribacillus bidgolensis TaxID=930129 RepID=A0A1G8RGF6_9BACI|nr:IDEAL domain-containing protein [Alteribacillus bidgolensis]SDJ16042.1 IDEAL domain-containing protein [Alteribacillus bidgolensis]
MNNKKPYRSYSEIMKTIGNKYHSSEEDWSVLDTYIEMILDEAIYTGQIRILEEKINNALDSNNKPVFLELSAKYAKLKQNRKN